jgi:hypothetical protein
MHLEKKKKTNLKLFLHAAKMWDVSSMQKENFQCILQNISLLRYRSTEHKNGKKSKISKHEKLFYICLSKL